MKTLPILTAWLALVCSTNSTSQDKAVSVPASQDKRFVLEAGPHRLEELIDDSARFLGRNCICSPVELAAVTNRQIDLQKRLDLDAKGCERVISQLVYMLGFVMTRVDPAHDLYEWIAINGPRRADIIARAVRMAPEEVIIHTGLKMVVTCSIPMKHVNAANASNMLRPFFAASAQGVGVLVLGAVEPRSLCVTGFSDEVAKVIRTVQEADQPPERPEPSLDERLAKIEARLATVEKRGEPAK